MNPAQLLAHFEKIAGAPDAIPRLRCFIRELAVRGKLVLQDPKDDPVAATLRRIKVSGNAAGAFDVPPTWLWVNVGAVADTRLGKMLDQAKNRGTPRPYLRNISVRWFGFDLSDLMEMPFEDNELKEFALRPGDVLICEGGEPGRAAVWRSEGADIYFQKAIHRARFKDFVNPDYFVNAIRASADDGRLASSFTGTGIKHFTGKGLDAYRFPLPPFDEQCRIVARVDELMTLCDQLEAARAGRESRRDRLAASSLARLNTPSADSFQQDARFALDVFSALTTRPDQVKQLRQTILNLAVRGKLVPQILNDIPASGQIEEISATKVRLALGGNIKTEKTTAWTSDRRMPFSIPENWKWVRLDQLSELITKGSSPKWQGVNYVNKGDGLLFITSENVGHYRLRKLDQLKFVEYRFQDIEPRSMLNEGDILMNLVGASIGRTALYDLRSPANINQAVALIRLIKSKSSPSLDYILYYLNSPTAIDFMLGSRVTTAQPNISLTDAREFPIPFPPLAEQHRIVAKVDELLGLCDRLEASLMAGEGHQSGLLTAILGEALRPAEVRDEAA